jgi:hypothetical protein
MSERIELVFERERETKNTVRYQEIVADGAEPSIGTLYVRKTAIASLGTAESLRVTIEESER